MLKGEKTLLRAVELEDSRILSAWLNDRETNNELDIIYPLSKRYADEFVLDAEGSSKRTFIIDDENYKPIGIVIIDKIKWEYRHCEIGIAIYRKEKRNNGYGKDALKTLLDFVFNNMNMSLVYLNVLENNVFAIKLYSSIGFINEGLLRNRYFLNGKYYNIISMSLTTEEFNNQ